MLQASTRGKKLLGGIVAVSIFVFWILIDLCMFPILSLSYSYYELLSYGSWAIISLICFGILFWAGWFPMRDQPSKQNESPDLVG